MRDYGTLYGKEQTERVGPDPVEELHKGEGEVETQKTKQVPRGGI
jgi:hypothetical protein